jgi:hypothetical protein
MDTHKNNDHTRIPPSTCTIGSSRSILGAVGEVGLTCGASIMPDIKAHHLWTVFFAINLITLVLGMRSCTPTDKVEPTMALRKKGPRTLTLSFRGSRRSRGSFTRLTTTLFDLPPPHQEPSVRKYPPSVIVVSPTVSPATNDPR